MARPTLFDHPKFHRLAHILRMPEPHVLGHLEFIWRVAYASGNPVIGDALDVELAAKWTGENGVFVQALSEVRFIDTLDDGRYTIHDLEHHAPNYVKSRARMEKSRSQRGRNKRATKTNKSATSAQPEQTTSEPERNGCAPPTPAPAPAPTPVRETPRARQAPIHDTSHRKHAHCGRTCLPAGLFNEFVRRRNHAGADREIQDWALVVEHAWAEGGPHEHDEPGDAYDFWKARYAEQWPASTAAGKTTGATGDGSFDRASEESKQRYGALKW